MQIAYVVLAACLMLCWLALSAFEPRKLETPNSIIVLRYGAKMSCFALALALASSLIMMYVMWSFFWPTPGKLHLAGGLLAFVSIIAGLPLIEVTRIQIAVAEDGLTLSSPWLGNKVLFWRDVTRVR